MATLELERAGLSLPWRQRSRLHARRRGGRCRSRIAPAIWATSGDALAITRSVWKDSGQLVDADVTFRSNTFVLGDAAVFRQVAMHELGHVLGLDHSMRAGNPVTAR